MGGEVQKLVVVINGVDSGEVLERWVFNVETDKAVTTSRSERLPATLTNCCHLLA